MSKWKKRYREAYKNTGRISEEWYVNKNAAGSLILDRKNDEKDTCSQSQFIGKGDQKNLLARVRIANSNLIAIKP